MPAFRKLAALAAAHAGLFAGCAAQVGHGERLQPIEDGAADDERAAIASAQGPSAEAPSGQWILGHEGVELAFLEQWLLFADLNTGEPIEALSVCEPPHDDDCDPAACADTDRAGTVLTDWTEAEQSYRMLGTLPDGSEFVLFDLAATTLINRTQRPIGVLTDTQLQAHYAAAGVTLAPGRYTVLARAYTGLVPAEGVRFTLHAAGCTGALAEHACATEAVADGGKDDAVQGLSVNLSHGLFLDVPPGMYELRGERDGVACGHAEVRLDGETAQVLAPEIACP